MTGDPFSYPWPPIDPRQKNTIGSIPSQPAIYPIMEYDKLKGYCVIPGNPNPVVPDDRRDFWERAYHQAFAYREDGEVAAKDANEALIEWDKQFLKQEIKNEAYTERLDT